MDDMPTCDHCGSTREVDADANGAAICRVCKDTDARELAQEAILELSPGCECRTCTLARALIDALDERDVILADLLHALGRCGCEFVFHEWDETRQQLGEVWPEAHTVAIARLEARMT